MGSPKSLYEVAKRIAASNRSPLEAMSYFVSDFRHELQAHVGDAVWIREAIKLDPVCVQPVIDVWLAGFAEYLAQQNGFEPPIWTLAECRFLGGELMICLGSARQREHYESTTPDAWRRRGLLSGPAPEFLATS